MVISLTISATLKYISDRISTDAAVKNETKQGTYLQLGFRWTISLSTFIEIIVRSVAFNQLYFLVVQRRLSRPNRLKKSTLNF